MKVSDRDVAYIADLASLELTEDEHQRMLRDLNSILDHVAQLNELDTANVVPMAQVADFLAGPAGDESSAKDLRPDIVTPCLSRQEILRSAPDTDGVYFRVPKVIER